MTQERRRDGNEYSDHAPLERALKKQTQHTPGPWRVDQNNYSVSSSAGRFVAFAATTTQSVGIISPEMKANARLIAAAPDLLAAAEAMLDRLETNNGGLALDPVQQRGWAERFRTAIAKAKPQASDSESKAKGE